MKYSSQMADRRHEAAIRVEYPQEMALCKKGAATSTFEDMRLSPRYGK